ncbi:MAG: murein biosynthesis integral membrane protein MurJ [Methylacidiphilales bacterium]|nr:murein biosynthesis integral membrane protein MurJ [Candidatus Methylacidiphilales bacterium]
MSSTPSTARSASKIMAAIFGSRILGLFREILLSAIFGASLELDALKTAFRIPNLLRDLFAEGALSTAFVTTFSQKLAKEGKPEAFRLANLVLTTLAGFLFIVTVWGILFSDWIVRILAPGFAGIPGKMELTVTLTQIMFPFILVVALAAIYMGLLNSLGSFGLPASASTAFNVVSILVGAGAGWLYDPHFGSKAIYGFAIGVVAGGLIQWLIQVPRAWQLGFRPALALDFKDPGLRKVLILMMPAIIAGSAVQINVMVNTRFASSFGNGAVTWLDNSFRLMQLPIGMFGVAISMVTLPSVSRSAALENLSEFRSKIQESLRCMFFLTLPASAGLALAAHPIIALIFQRGAYKAFDTGQTALLLQYYTLGLAGYAAIKVLAPAFYALDRVKTPVQISLTGIALNIGFNLLFIHVLHLGLISLPLSTSLVALINFVQLAWWIQKPIGRLTDLAFCMSLGKIAFSTLIMILALLGLRYLLSGTPAAIQVLLLMSTGATVYFGAAWLLKLEEIHRFTGFIEAKLKPRSPGV